MTRCECVNATGGHALHAQYGCSNRVIGWYNHSVATMRDVQRPGRYYLCVNCRMPYEQAYERSGHPLWQWRAIGDSDDDDLTEWRRLHIG